MGKKNGPGTFISDQRGFFTKMSIITGNNRIPAGFADTGRP
jgi:hypothetical protein